MRCLLVTAFVILAIGDSIRGDTPVSENPNPIGDLYGDPLPKGAVARLGTVRFRADSLLAMAWSPDSKMLASGGIMTEIRLWDVMTGKEAGRFSESTSASVLAWSPDAKMIASAWEDENSTIHVWDVVSRKEIRQLDGKHKDGVKSLAWSPDGKTLASGGCDRTIHLWDPETGKEFRSLSGHEGSVESLAWSPDGKRLASGGQDKAIRLWDPMTGKQVRRLPGQVTRAERLAWSPDGMLLLSGTVNKTVRLLDVATNKESWLAGVSSPGWSRDGKMLALENGDGTVDICEPGTGKDLRRLAGKDLSLVSWSPDGKMLASANGHAIHVWDHSLRMASILAPMPISVSIWPITPEPNQCKLKQRWRESFPPILANRARASGLDGISCNSESRVATRITRVFQRKSQTFPMNSLLVLLTQNGRISQPKPRSPVRIRTIDNRLNRPF